MIIVMLKETMAIVEVMKIAFRKENRPLIPINISFKETKIQVDHLSGVDNVEDIFTKMFGLHLHQQFIDQIGMHDTHTILQQKEVFSE